MKIYTKKGDAGKTGLVSGTNVSKSDRRIALYGEVDELNSYIGLLVAEMDIKSFKEEIDCLTHIQNKLFTLGSNFACETVKRVEFKLPQLEEGDTLLLEKEIDRMEMKLDPLSNFILPAGTKAAAIAHVVRCKCRHVERLAVDFKQTEEAPEHSLAFLNRLSDYFFVLSRYANKVTGVKEVIWTSK